MTAIAGEMPNDSAPDAEFGDPDAMTPIDETPPPPAPTAAPPARRRNDRNPAPESGGDPLNLRELLAVVRRNWWLVSGATVLLGSVAAYLVLTAQPKFRAAGIIRVANSRQAMAGNLGTDNSPSSVGLYSDPLLSQIQMLSSRALALTVVDSEPGLLRLRIPGVSPSLLSGVQIVDSIAADSVKLGFAVESVTVESPTGRATAAYGAPLVVPELRLTVGSRPAVPETWAKLLTRDAAAARVSAGLTLKQRAETDFIDVSYTAAEPIEAQFVTNRLLRVFRASSAVEARRLSQERRDFVRQQLARHDSTEASAQRTLADFRGREQMFGGREKFAEGQKDVLSMSMQRSALANDRDVAGSLLQGISSAAGPERARALRVLVSTPGINSNPVVAQVQDRLVRYRTTRDSMTIGRFSSAASNPDVQRLDTLIAQAESQMGDAVQAYISSISAKLSVLDDALSKTTVALDRLPRAAAEEQRLSSEIESLHRIGDQLREELQKSSIATAVEGGQIEIVDLAGAAVEVPTSSIARILIGLLVGLVLGIAASFVREHLNTTIKRRNDVERELGISTVGVIPAIETMRGLRAGSQARDTQLPRRSMSERGTRKSRNAKQASLRAAIVDEAFDALRTHMLYHADAPNMKTVVVTSCAPKDGKSTVCANIAEAFARTGSRVLLVDADLRRPRLHQMFDEPVPIGLSDVLLGRASMLEALRGDPAPRSLCLLTAGTRVDNPSELLSSDAMRRFLLGVRARFDLIVIDAPPVLVVSDAALLGRQSDGVLFVLRAGNTEPVAALAALDELESVSARVIGAVLNDPSDTLTQYDASHYYAYYNDYFMPSTA